MNGWDKRMTINEERTFADFGYVSSDLSHASHKKIWVICNDCGEERVVEKYQCRDLCKSCSVSGKNHADMSGKNNPMFGRTGDKSPHFGKHLTEETKQKISKSRKGEKNPMYGKTGKDSPMFGRHHTEESKEKIRESHIGTVTSEETKEKLRISSTGKLHTKETKERISKSRLGKNNPNWNPNLSNKDRQHTRNYPEYYKWRTSIFERDNYTCQICNKVGTILNAHHFESYANNLELRVIVSNGVTLCKSCHDNFHKKYGRGNNTKEQYIEFKGSYKNEYC